MYTKSTKEGGKRFKMRLTQSLLLVLLLVFIPIISVWGTPTPNSYDLDEPVTDIGVELLDAPADEGNADYSEDFSDESSIQTDASLPKELRVF